MRASTVQAYITCAHPSIPSHPIPSRLRPVDNNHVNPYHIISIKSNLSVSRSVTLRRVRRVGWRGGETERRQYGAGGGGNHNCASSAHPLPHLSPYAGRQAFNYISPESRPSRCVESRYFRIKVTPSHSSGYHGVTPFPCRG